MASNDGSKSALPRLAPLPDVELLSEIDETANSRTIPRCNKRRKEANTRIVSAGDIVDWATDVDFVKVVVVIKDIPVARGEGQLREVVL